MGKQKIKTKQKCIRLNLDRTFDEVSLPREGGMIHDGEDRILMQPAAVFTERKGRLLRGKRHIILFVKGTSEALKFKEVVTEKGTEISMDDPNPFWTMKDSARFVEKKIAESLKENKPMTWLQFILLLIPLGITCFGVLKLLFHLGAL